MEEGEQPEAALRRELREEIGLEIEQPRLVQVRAFKKPKQVEIVFSCQAAGDTDQLNFEIQRVAWFRLEELPKELPKNQVQLIRCVLADGAMPQD